jgi:hypothetical protein
MKDLKKFISGFIIVMCICLSAKVYGQSQDNTRAYNTALHYYSNEDYGSSLNELNSFMDPMEDNPSAWINAGSGYVELIYKVYRLAAACYYQSGDSGSADVIVDNLIYVLSDYYYESDIIDRYNNTSLNGY